MSGKILRKDEKFISICGSSKPLDQAVELKHFPLATMEGVIAQTWVELDNKIRSEITGSLRIIADGPTTVRPSEVSDLCVETARA